MGNVCVDMPAVCVESSEAAEGGGRKRRSCERSSSQSWGWVSLTTLPQSRPLLRPRCGLSLSSVVLEGGGSWAAGVCHTVPEITHGGVQVREVMGAKKQPQPVPETGVRGERRDTQRARLAQPPGVREEHLSHSLQQHTATVSQPLACR